MTMWKKNPDLRSDLSQIVKELLIQEQINKKYNMSNENKKAWSGIDVASARISDTSYVRPDTDNAQLRYPSTPENAISTVSLREINIRPLNHGFIVTVGCQTLAIETAETLVEKLTAYLKDPYATEIAQLSGTFFKK